MKQPAKNTCVNAKKAANKSAKPRVDVYQMVTDAICAQLEAGVIPWQMPWTTAAGVAGPRNYATGRPYTGINAFLLNMTGKAPLFMTFNQAKQAGGSIRKGAKGYPVIFFQLFKKEDKESGQVDKIPVLRYYTVFNVADVEGVEIKLPEVPEAPVFTPLAKCEQVVKDWEQCPPIKHWRQQAYYSPSVDYVNMPKPETFKSAEHYYATLFHELTHSTGHESRLNRPEIMGAIKFGNASYAKEELTAEMGAAFLCALTGIDATTRDNNASYLAGWLRKLNPQLNGQDTQEAQRAYWLEKFQQDKKLLVSAASRAQKAADMIFGVLPESVPAEEPAEEVTL